MHIDSTVLYEIHFQTLETNRVIRVIRKSASKWLLLARRQLGRRVFHHGIKKHNYFHSPPWGRGLSRHHLHQSHLTHLRIHEFELGSFGSELFFWTPLFDLSFQLSISIIVVLLHLCQKGWVGCDMCIALLVFVFLVLFRICWNLHSSNLSILCLMH